MSDDRYHHYAIYEYPEDWPENVVVRRWAIVEGNPNPVPEKEPFGVVATVESARHLIPPGRVLIRRHPSDVPCLVETWM